MKILFIQLLSTVGLTFCAAIALFPILIKLSPRLGLIDIPNYRKLHRQPVPAIGGFVVIMSLITASLFSAPMQEFIFKHASLNTALVVMMITGLIDDRFNLPVKLRLVIQVLCAFAIAYDGARISSLYGFLGIHDLPLTVQYFLTVFVITGVTNAFNLMDGIDGLAGSMALINMAALSIMSVALSNLSWLFLLLPLMAALTIFLRYNWRPASIFMGDSGSLVFGLIMSSVGISFIRQSGNNETTMTAEFIVIVTGFCTIPVLDAARVFYQRIKKGRSPFHADRTHLHHLLTNHHLVHSTATSKLLKLHIAVLLLSVIAVPFVNIYWVIAGQIIGVAGYIHFLRMMSYFHRWYRVIKKMELAS
jgi:UDP-GlcNAc:undecaprenyl-phosphate GlcNAc-1-phosphate transferase